MEKKKISLRGISEILSEKELKNVMGGSDCGTSTPVYGVSYNGCTYDGYRNSCGYTLDENTAVCAG